MFDYVKRCLLLLGVRELPRHRPIIVTWQLSYQPTNEQALTWRLSIWGENMVSRRDRRESMLVSYEKIDAPGTPYSSKAVCFHEPNSCLHRSYKKEKQLTFLSVMISISRDRILTLAYSYNLQCYSHRLSGQGIDADTIGLTIIRNMYRLTDQLLYGDLGYSCHDQTELAQYLNVLSLEHPR